MEGKEREKTERLRFGRFFYRFPNGESGAGACCIACSFSSDSVFCVPLLLPLCGQFSFPQRRVRRQRVFISSWS